MYHLYVTLIQFPLVWSVCMWCLQYIRYRWLHWRSNVGPQSWGWRYPVFLL